MTQDTHQAEQIVTAAYRGLLRRDPDAEGLALYAGQLRAGETLAAILGKFVSADEFQTLMPDRTFPLDGAPPMRIEPVQDPAQRRAIWDHIAKVWAAYGEQDPFWSVVTDERWRAPNMTDEEAIAGFYATGLAEVTRLDAWLARNHVHLPATARCAEYGCGVGRITAPLARRFGQVVGFDISAPHLRRASAYLGTQGIANAELVQVRAEADLVRMDGIDLFYSILVLQHNPPPVIADILGRAFAGLRPGGVAFFQLPTYGAGYGFSAAGYWDHVARQETMEMHALPQADIFALARAHGVHPLEVQPDWCIGMTGQWTSNTILMRKEG